MKNMGGREACICSKDGCGSIDVCLLFNGVVVFSSMYFLFPFVKPNSSNVSSSGMSKGRMGSENYSKVRLPKKAVSSIYLQVALFVPTGRASPLSLGHRPCPSGRLSLTPQVSSADIMI
jgi:hypothetical protein